MPLRESGLKVVRKQSNTGYGHFYYQLLTMPWTRFVLVFFLIFLAVHALFACLYMLDPSSILGPKAGFSWWDAFCFSVQSLSTIGYGVLHPNGLYANILVTIEAFVGLLYGAILTGCFFAKISRPSPQFLFSDQILLYPVDGVPTLVVRIANKLDGSLIDVKADVHARIYDAKNNIFHLQKLKLRRDGTPTLSLNWLLFHRIDEQSPLYNIPYEDWAERDIRVLVHVTGHDSIYQQLVHDSRFYGASNIVRNHQFADMLTVKDDTIELDLSKISIIEPTGDRHDR